MGGIFLDLRLRLNGLLVMRLKKKRATKRNSRARTARPARARSSRAATPRPPLRQRTALCARCTVGLVAQSDVRDQPAVENAALDKLVLEKLGPTDYASL